VNEIGMRSVFIDGTRKRSRGFVEGFDWLIHPRGVLPKYVLCSKTELSTPEQIDLTPAFT